MSQSAMPEWMVEGDNNPIVSVCDRPASFKALADTSQPEPDLWSGATIPVDVKVLAEATGWQTKRALVIAPVDGWNNWEIRCDEGKLLGGDDSAPYPLSYFCAGVAFCLMTHIQVYVRVMKLQLRKFQIELKGKFTTTKGTVETGRQGAGSCEAFEIDIVVDSDEPPERIRQLVEICERACIAVQTIANAIPTSTRLVLNDQPTPVATG